MFFLLLFGYQGPFVLRSVPRGLTEHLSHVPTPEPCLFTAPRAGAGRLSVAGKKGVWLLPLRVCLLACFVRLAALCLVLVALLCFALLCSCALALSFLLVRWLDIKARSMLCFHFGESQEA